MQKFSTLPRKFWVKIFNLIILNYYLKIFI
jgi:hypothetical protein